MEAQGLFRRFDCSLGEENVSLLVVNACIGQVRRCMCC